MEPDQNSQNPATPNGFTPERWKSLREEVAKRIYGEDPGWGLVNERNYELVTIEEASPWEGLPDEFQEEFRERADKVLPILVEQAAVAWELGNDGRKTRNPYSPTGVEDQGDYHVGRAWSGTDIEDACPCPQEPCGLVSMNSADPSCEQHRPDKTTRQVHASSQCPSGKGQTSPWSTGV